MKISQEGLSLIKRFEGCRLKSYKCSANVLTIGYGHTSGVKETDTITQDEADKLLQEDVEQFEKYVDDNVTVKLGQSQFDSLVAWTFNLGVGNLRESTMLKKLNNEDYKSVPSEMKRWNKAGGKTLDGLIRRREAESLLFQNKEWHKV
jgi:lysozyme